MNMCEFKPFDVVKHFKRETINKEKYPLLYYYKIIGTGYTTDNAEYVMIYQALYEPQTIFVRNFDEFMNLVDTGKYPEVKQKYRFEKVGEEELNEIIKKISRWGTATELQS